MNEREQLPYRMGLRHDTPYRRTLYTDAVEALPYLSAGSLALGLSSLAGYELETLDQGMTGSCNGHRCCQGVFVAQAAKAGSRKDVVPFSPKGLYDVAREYERRRLMVPMGVLLTDSGSMSGDVIDGLATFGAPPMTVSSIEGRHSDITVDNVNAETRLDEAANSRLVTGEYIIDTSDTEATLLTIQRSLEAGWPVGLDIICDTLFQEWGQVRRAIPLNACDPSDPKAGGHAVLLTELQILPDGSPVFSILNSWGNNWGAPAYAGGVNSGGHFRGGLEWFKTAVMQAVIFKVTDA